MATSLVSFKDLCVSCSCHSDLKYHIVKNSGHKGPSYAIASEVYCTSFYCHENYGTYVCEDCYGLLQSIVKTRNNLEELSWCLEENSQTLQSKRVLNSTPNSNLLSKYKETLPSSSQCLSKIPGKFLSVLVLKTLIWNLWKCFIQNSQKAHFPV